MTNINISLKTFFVGFLFILGIIFAYQLRGIILTFFVAFIIFSALKPIIDNLDKKGLSRILSVVIVYLLGIILFSLLLFTIVEGIVLQVREIATHLDLSQENISLFINNNVPVLNYVVDVETLSEGISHIFDPVEAQALTSGQALTQLIENISPIATEGLSFVSRFVGGLVSVFMVIFLSIYMVMPRKDFYEGFLELLPKTISKKSTELIDKIRFKLGAWTLGELFLMIVIGVVTYIVIILPGLFIDNYQLGRFALMIAIVAGLFEAIPNVGPFLTLMIAIIFAIATGSGIALVIYIIVMFILLQQAESLFIVPVVMKRAIDLSPILSILSVLAGFELGGPIGALLSVPIVGVLQIITLEFLKNWKND